MDRRTCAGLIGVLSCALAIAPSASACVADVFTLDRLAMQADHVVTATVGEVQSYWTPGHRSIESRVTLTGVTRLTAEGTVEAPDVTFTVVGGTVGDTTMRVCCIPEMHAGERWVLFLQSDYRQSPVLGMERGMFRIATIDGEDRVADFAGHAIAGIDPDSRIRISPEADAADAVAAPKTMRGGVSSVRVIERNEAALDAGRAAPAPMTVEGFLAEVRRRLPPERGLFEGEIAVAHNRPAMMPARPKSVEEVAGEAGGAK